MVIERRHGVGGVVYQGIGSANPTVPNLSTMSWWERLWYQTSDTNLWNNVTDNAAYVYQRAQYGDIPRLQDTGNLPTPGAPRTVGEMTTPGAWTPDLAAETGQGAYTDAQRAYIQSKIDDGSYNPDGNLPIDASGDVSLFGGSSKGLMAILAIVAVVILINANQEYTYAA